MKYNCPNSSTVIALAIQDIHVPDNVSYNPTLLHMPQGCKVT